MLFWVVVSLAAINVAFVTLTWYWYLRVWWGIRSRFEGVVPFHVVSVGAAYLVFALLSLGRLDGWRGPLVLMAYSMATGSLLWILWYERARFLHSRVSLTTVMLIEDSVSNGKLATATLRSDGFVVEWALDAADALMRLGRVRPAIVLVDLRMPGISGADLVTRLRGAESLRGVPLIACTGYGPEAAIAAGCDGYISKPIDTRTFADLVRGFLPRATP